VALVLGAGNVASIGPLDLLHMLFYEGHVAMLKLNPVNDYLGPHVERVFGELIEDGFVDMAYGGAEVGSYLSQHEQVDKIHITGASRTHDAIVFGAGEDGAARREANRPLLDKPITSELGNVGPVVILPGDWGSSDLRNQAEHVATQIVQNAGFNCNAAKVIVLPAAWPQKVAFMDTLRHVLRERPSRPSYYPGAEERFEKFRASHPNVEMLGERRPGVVPPSLLVGVDSEFEHLSFEEEAFCQIAATTEVGGADPSAYLDRAVDFCNDSLYGTLNATVIIDPSTRQAIAPAVDRAISRLRYGTIGINLWAAAGFVLGVTPWGAYPGHALDDIQSGRGFVHNARLIDRPLKTVIEAPFRIFPKPAWSVYHRNSTDTLTALAAFEAEPGIRNLAAVVANAVRY
jgi:acyl-CoA reductase-like NAD-dependent aldehyde dehydrogenase